ncbi:MAG: hypothetical protein FWG39_01675 [Alphaproteobacteria bacterium]|nr:hypothetical protein [Alphaproteobacteria bacterium]
MKNKIFMIICAIALAACSSRVQTFTAISTDNINPSKSIESGTVIKNVRGQDKERIIFIFPTGTTLPNEAVRDALKNSDGGDILVNAKMYRYSWYIPFIYGEYKWVVEGDAVALGAKAIPDKVAVWRLTSVSK